MCWQAQLKKGKGKKKKEKKKKKKVVVGSFGETQQPTEAGGQKLLEILSSSVSHWNWVLFWIFFSPFPSKSVKTDKRRLRPEGRREEVRVCVRRGLRGLRVIAQRKEEERRERETRGEREGGEGGGCERCARRCQRWERDVPGT